MKEHLDKKAKASQGRLEVFYTLDKSKDGWKGGKGFVNEEMIKQYMPKPKDASGMVFICGPDPMLGHGESQSCGVRTWTSLPMDPGS